MDPEIFATKLFESCQKARRILNVFALHILLGAVTVYVTNSTQSPLASNTSASCLQDRSARVQVCPWCCSCISAETPCPGRRRPRVTTATVCIYSMYSVTEGEDVNGTAKFCVPWAVSLEQFAINSARQQYNTIQYNTMWVFSAPYTRNRTWRHYNGNKMCV